MPANKVKGAGSETEVMQANNPKTLLLQERLKVSTPADLVLGVTLECSIVTDVMTSGSDDEQGAFGQVRIWIEIDGVAVPVDETAGDDGKVVFCNRAYARQVQDFCDPPVQGTDDCDDTEKTFLRTRTANAFNWLALNPSAYDTGTGNVLDVKVYGEFTTQRTEGAMAEAAVGKRTLMIHPVMTQNDESLGDQPPPPPPDPTPTPSAFGALPLGL